MRQQAAIAARSGYTDFRRPRADVDAHRDGQCNAVDVVIVSPGFKGGCYVESTIGFRGCLWLGTRDGSADADVAGICRIELHRVVSHIH